MLRKKNCVAMLLAGGQGSRLGILTKNVAKPAVPYGGKYRIIDFPLSNCTNSGIDVVGVLTQYQPLELNAYIGSGAPWDLDLTNGTLQTLFVPGHRLRPASAMWKSHSAVFQPPVPASAAPGVQQKQHPLLQKAPQSPESHGPKANSASAPSASN